MIVTGVITILITLIISFLIIQAEIDSDHYSRAPLLLISMVVTSIINVVYYGILSYSLYNNII